MQPPRRIDPTSGWPIYHQLADMLRDDILTGRIAPGALLPSEGRLSQQHEIGVDTVRDALAVLRREGLIVTQRGRGSRARQLLERTVKYVPADADITARMPTEAERRDLGIPEGVPVLVVERDGEVLEVLAGDRTVLRYGEAEG